MNILSFLLTLILLSGSSYYFLDLNLILLFEPFALLTVISITLCRGYILHPNHFLSHLIKILIHSVKSMDSDSDGLRQTLAETSIGTGYLGFLISVVSTTSHFGKGADAAEFGASVAFGICSLFYGVTFSYFLFRK